MTAHEADDPLTSVAAHRPQLFVRHAGDALAELVRHAPPAFLAAGLGPDRVRLDRIPGRHMNAVGDVADRNFGGWPAWKQRLEDPRSEEHTSELQSYHELVCRLLLEKKKNEKNTRWLCLKLYTNRNYFMISTYQ